MSRNPPALARLPSPAGAIENDSVSLTARLVPWLRSPAVFGEEATL